MRKFTRSVSLPPDSIIEAVWRCGGFRAAVAKKLCAACGDHPLPGPLDAEGLERRLFLRARTKEEYLESAARAIVSARARMVASSSETRRAPSSHAVVAPSQPVGRKRRAAAATAADEQQVGTAEAAAPEDDGGADCGEELIEGAPRMAKMAKVVVIQN